MWIAAPAAEIGTAPSRWRADSGSATETLTAMDAPRGAFVHSRAKTSTPGWRSQAASFLARSQPDSSPLGGRLSAYPKTAWERGTGTFCSDDSAK